MTKKALTSAFLSAQNIPCAKNTEPYLTEEVYGTSATALAVALPEDTTQVAAIANFSHQNSLALVPQGGNSNRTIAAIPDPNIDSIVVNLENMHSIEHISENRDYMILQAGCTLAQAQSAAEDVDRIIGIDLGARDWCHIGGNISTNAGGMQSVRYGNMREQILGLEVVTADGQILNLMNSLVKNNSGYDLKQLFIGAEGTLGIITRAILRLYPKPQHIQVTAIACSDVQQASIFFRDAQKQWGAQLQRCEYLSASISALIMSLNHDLKFPFTPYPKALFLLELSDILDPDPLHQWLNKHLESGLISNAIPAQNQGQIEDWWKIRENCGGINPAQGKQIKHDIAVPVAQLPYFIQAAEDALAQQFPHTIPVPFGHWGDGNLHYNIAPKDSLQPIDQDKSAINHLIENLAMTHQGTFSAEHGIGSIKKESLQKYKDPASLALMKTIKSALDPKNLMNPNKIF